MMPTAFEPTVGRRAVMAPRTEKRFSGERADWPAPTRIAARLEPGFATAIAEAWASAQRGADDASLQSAARSADADGLFAALHPARLAQAVVDVARPRILGAFRVGAETAADGLASFGVQVVRAFGVQLDAINPLAVAWARAHAADLVVADDDIKRAIRDLVVASQAEGVTPDRLARQIRELIGLDARRARALQRFEAGLRERGLSVAQIERRADRYADALRRQRALAIARTETIAAVNGGQQALWDEAVAKGELDTRTHGKRWLVTDDEVLCPICEALGEEIVGLNESFSGGHAHPPAHPNCRCAIGIARLPDGRPGTLPTPETHVDTMAAYMTSAGKFTAERQRLHARLIAEAIEGVPVSANPTAYMMGGGPATGKSTLLASGKTAIPKGLRAVHVDPDAFKALLPEYQALVAAGDIRASSFVHEESSYLAKRLTAEAAKRRLDVIIDGTGDSSFEKLRAKVESLRAAGHRVVATYATVDTEVAVERALARGLKTGRYVPEAYIREIHQAVSRTMPEAARRGLYDALELFDTSGRTPQLIIRATRDGIEVVDEALWQRFLAKGNEAHAVFRSDVVLGLSSRIDAAARTYVGAYGQAWPVAEALPAGVARGPMGQCYRNASLLAMEHPEFRYVEGFADRNGITYAHAWVVDADGFVIDPTWGQDAAVAYFGVAYRTDAYLAHIIREEVYGVLGGNTRTAQRAIASGGEGLR